MFNLMSAPTAKPQLSTGSLSGTIIDAQRAPIPNAEVSITNVATREKLTTITGADGSFHGNALLAGLYTVRVTKTSFKQLLIENAPVNAGSDLGLGELQLNLGEASTTITVQSVSGLLERTEPQLSRSFGTQALTSLPGILENNGLDNLALLVPGVADIRDLGFSSANGAQFSVNGLRGRSTDQQIDGQNNNDNYETGPLISLGDPEFVAQYELTTGNFDAEFGRNSGAVVNIITKSGTNNLHGSLYATESNWRFNSLSPNQKNFEGLTGVPAFNDAFLGGTVGGPIAKDKLFFFAGVNSEILNQTQVFATAQLTPTPSGLETLGGCFPDSTSVQALLSYGPYSVKAGNPTPLGVAIPMNIPGCGTVVTAGIQRSLPADARQNNFVIKFDYQTPKNHFSGRYLYARRLSSNSDGAAAAGYSADGFQLSQGYNFSWTRFLGVSTANEFRASYGRNDFQDGGNSLGGTVPRASKLGDALTFVTFSNSSLLSFGVPPGLPAGRIANTYQFHDNWTHIAGRHALKLGVDVTQVRAPITMLINYNGSFQFTDFAAFAANSPDQIRIASGNSYLDFRETDLYPYAADQIRLTNSLSLTLGLTWSYYGQPANILHKITTRSQTGDAPLWDPSLPLSITTSPEIPAAKNDWAPGIGFAWSPRSNFLHLGTNTVFRGGYRMSYDPAAYITYAKAANDSPNVISTTLTGGGAEASPLPAVPTGDNVRTLLGPHLQTGIFDPRGFGQTTVSPDFGPDRVHQWSLGIQHEISHNAVLEVRYVGNHGTRLFQTIDGNPYILGLANTHPDLVPAGWRPCPASQAAIPELVGRVNCTAGALLQERTNTGYSDYNGLQIELRSTSLWHQLTLQSSYTFSKTTDNTSEIGATGFAGNTSALSQSQVNFTDQEHGLSGLDFPHKFVLSAVEEIPLFKNRGGVVGQILGGWRAAAIYTLSSGQPYTAVQFALSCNAGGDICAASPSDSNPYDPAFNAEYALPDGSLRPFLGSNNAPVQSVGIFAKDICASDSSGILCGNSAISPTTLISLNQFNNGFTGTKLDSSGRVIPDSTHPAQIVAKDQVRFIANTMTAAAFFGSPFGNVGRNTLRDGHINLLNFSALKVTKLSESLTLQLHTDFLNALNHPNYSSVDPFIDDAGRAAEATGFANPRLFGFSHRTISFGAKLLF
ncbi:MAG TPA: carboxypeptidase regulatory-like domain-containing protein [Candidatus Acidoferrum sp.]|nr:carboxypeptidase regulatory-like domain-containing protein [Candidatus Acidoferrum sp.]